MCKFPVVHNGKKHNFCTYDPTGFFSEIAAKSDIPDCVDLDGEGNGQGSTPLWGPL